MKTCYLPQAGDKKRIRNKIKGINRSLWKDKLANKSVASVNSM